MATVLVFKDTQFPSLNLLFSSKSYFDYHNNLKKKK